MEESSRPAVPEGIGQRKQFVDLKLQQLSHKTAEFRADNNKFDIKMKAPIPIRATCQLFVYQKDNTEEKVEGGAFVQQDGDILTFSIAVPGEGWYKLIIFAVLAEKDTRSLEDVYTHLFYMPQTHVQSHFVPYPKQFADFKKGCFLHSPFTLDPKSDLHEVEFKIFVPTANTVAIKVGDEWMYMAQNSDNQSLFSTVVDLEPHKGRNSQVRVNAALGDDEKHFVTLLQYVL